MSDPDNHALRVLLERQIGIQDEANSIMRGLVAALQGLAQETEELRKVMAKQTQ